MTSSTDAPSHSTRVKAAQNAAPATHMIATNVPRYPTAGARNTRHSTRASVLTSSVTTATPEAASPAARDTIPAPIHSNANGTNGASAASSATDPA